MRPKEGCGSRANPHGFALALALVLVLPTLARTQRRPPPGGQQGQQCVSQVTGTDSRGESCNAYSSSPEHCGCCDTSSFAAADCCECQDVTVHGSANWWAQVLHTWPQEATVLNLTRKGIQGVLPTDIAGRLPRLIEIDLSGNQLTGSLPPQLGNLSNLTKLLVSNNLLSGSIPAELGGMASLQELRLNSNQLTGSLPPQLGNLSQLTKLQLSSNLLSGNIPAELGGMTSLQELWLNSNQLTGGLPPQLSNLSNLTKLELSSNLLSGSIPAELGGLASLQELMLDHNQFTGPLPRELGQLSNLEDLSLIKNKLSGALPPELGRLASLRSLDLTDNHFSGSLPPELGNISSLERLTSWNNRFSGGLPPELGRLTRLHTLSLSSSGLTGPIPRELGQMGSLRGMYLDRNQLSGSLPPELGDLSELRDLWLTANQLSGRLPPELAKLERLNHLRLSENQFSGEVPSELGDLSKLQRLCLDNNLLEGPLPPEFGNLALLKILWLQNNNFTGALPSELGNLVRLEELWLHSNRFSGHLPSELGNLQMLLTLRLSNNQLTGGLPSSFDGMRLLESLDASSNPELCGDATVLERLESLVGLELAGCCFSNEDLPALPPLLQHLDLTGNRFSWIPSTWQPQGHPLRALLMSANNLTAWDTSGIVPLSLNSGAEWVCGYRPPGERLAFEKLERLEVSSNPLNVSAYEFLESLSHLQELTVLRARDMNLRGALPLVSSDESKLVPNMPDTGLCAGHNLHLSGGPSFPALAVLDLSGNALTDVSARPPAGLMQADLSRNALTTLNPAWWRGGTGGFLQHVDAQENPGLRLVVLLDPDTTCRDRHTRELVASDDGWTRSGSSAECTTLCPAERTQLLADASVNESVLCRCSEGQGVGRGCSPCPSNTFSSLSFEDGHYRRKCLACPTDSSLQGGLGLCLTDCTCRAGHFMAQVQNGTAVEVGRTPCSRLAPEGRCLACGLFRTSAPGSLKSADCFCNSNTSNGGWGGLLERGGQCACPDGQHMNFADRVCEFCQAEEDCSDWTLSLEPPRVKPGFWALTPPPKSAGETFGNFSRHDIWRCQSTEACPGGAACGMNLTGTACGLCKQGHFRTSSGSCSPCPRPHIEARFMLALFLLTSSILPLLAHATLSANPESRGLFMTLRSFRTSLRQLVKFGQVLGLVSLMRVEWPPIVLSVFTVFRAFSLDFASWTGVACLDAQQQQSVTMELAFRWLLPVAGIVITCMTAVTFTLCKAGGSWVLAMFQLGTDVKINAKSRFGCLRRLGQIPSFRPLDVLRVLLFFLHLLFPSLLQNSLLPLTCSPSPIGSLTMNAFPQVQCWRLDDDTIFWPLAVAGLVQSALLSLGFPLVLYFAWKSVDTSSKTFFPRKAPNATSEALAVIEERRRWWVFVFEDFRPHKTFWPLEALGKDILLNLIVVLLPAFGTAQLLLTSLISLTYAVRAFSTSPYTDFSNTLLETCTATSIAVLCIFSAGMGFQSEPDVRDLGFHITGGREGPAYYQRAMTLVFLQGLTLVGPVTILAFQLLMAFPRSRRIIPARLKPLSEEQRAQWSQTFSAAMELETGPLPQALSELDHLDFCMFMRTVRIAPRTRRLMSVSSQSSTQGRGSSCEELSTGDPEGESVPYDEMVALQKKIAALATEIAQLQAENAELQALKKEPNEEGPLPPTRRAHDESSKVGLRHCGIAPRNNGVEAAQQPPRPALPDADVTLPSLAREGHTGMDKQAL